MLVHVYQQKGSDEKQARNHCGRVLRYGKLAYADKFEILSPPRNYIFWLNILVWACNVIMNKINRNLNIVICDEIDNK